MAVTQKNVIEDVIISTHVDALSPSVEKMRGRVESSMKQINRQFKDVGDVFRLAIGGAAGAMVIRTYSQLVQFAKEHNTEAGKIGTETDKILNNMQMTVVSSEAFKKTMEGVNTIAGLLDKTLSGISGVMDKLDIRFLDFFGGAGALTGAYQRFKEQFFPTQKDADNSAIVAAIVAKDYKRIADLQAAVARGREAAERGRKQEIEDYHAMEAAWRGYGETFSEYANEQRRYVNEMNERLSAYEKEAALMERLRSTVPKAAAPNFTGIDNRKNIFEDQLPSKETIKDYERLSNLYNVHIPQGMKLTEKSLSEFNATLESNATTMRETWYQGFTQAFVNGFAAMGQAIVEGENVLKAFVANFLSAIGQMAVQFGSMMILYGIAGQAVPFLGISGGAAIAAGAALVVFGGALTALAGTMQKTATAGSASGNYRPDSSFDGGQRAGNTTVTVVVQALDPSSIGDSVLRNLGLKVGKELQKQEYLGRSLAFGGG